MSLRSIISNNPAIEIREAVATDLVEDNGRVTGLTYKDREGNLQVSAARMTRICSILKFFLRLLQNVYAPLTVVCDGLHSRFRKELVDQKTVAKSCFVGVVVKDVDLPYPNYGHVILGMLLNRVAPSLKFVDPPLTFQENRLPFFPIPSLPVMFAFWWTSQSPSLQRRMVTSRNSCWK